MMTTHAQPPTASVPSLDPTVLGEYGTTGSLRLLTWPALAASGADAAVTARAGGVSSGPYATLNLSLSVGDDPERVLENRRRLAAAFGAGPGDFVFARQVHGANVRVVGEAERGSGAFALDDAIGDADALVTTTPGLVLAILTADCVPIVLHDPVAGVLACVHAGWRGTVARVAAAAVAAMQTLGSRPADVIAGIGPAMAPDRYQVGPDVHHAITQSFGPPAAAFIRPDPATADPADPAAARSGLYPETGQPRPELSAPAFLRPYPGDRSGGHWLLDLWAANRYVLQEAGVPDAQIHVTGIPTGPAGHDTFFSDRAARPCGRLALVARLGTT
jgi:polyphenol oxidase